MPQRVVHIVQKMAPGGLEVLALELSRQLPGDHYIISLESDGPALAAAWPRLIQDRDRLIGLNKKPGFDVALFLGLRRLLTTLAPCAVLTHHAGPLVYGGPAARVAGVTRLIHVEHDVWHYEGARRRRLMRAVVALTRPTIVGVAEAMRSPLHEMFPGRPVHIIANGVDLDRFTGDRLRTRKILGIADDAQVIGAAGRLEWVKGHDILIRAVAMLDPKSILFILGDGSRRAELQALALTLGVAGRIQFLGHRDDAAALLPALDVFCQPSRSEGLPLAILEAQACGVPVIASNVGDMPAAICPESGRLTPPEDVPALAAALRATLGRNAPASPRAFVASRFDWRRTLNGYAKLLEA